MRELALAAPGSDAQLAEQVARIFARQLDRSRPLWELYVIEGLEGGRVGGAHEDPPRRGRRALRRGDPERAARRLARGTLHRTARRRATPARRAHAERRRDARPRARGTAAPAGARGAAAAEDARQPRRAADDAPPPRRRRTIASLTRSVGRASPRAATTAASSRAATSALRARASRDSISPYRRCVRLDPAVGGQGDQERVRLHRQRRGDGDVRRRDALVPRSPTTSCPTRRS